MYNSARSRRVSRRTGCRRNRRVNQMGGAGEAYTLGGFVAGAPIINNYGQEIVRFPSCEEAVRPGYLTDATIKGGLPGFSQRGGRGGVLETGADQLAAQMGGRRRRGSRKSRRGTRKMRGGRYTNEFNVVGASGIGIMEPSYSGCGTGLEAITNPLNPAPGLQSLITAPPPLVPVPTPGSGDVLQKGGSGRKTRRQRGGDSYGPYPQTYFNMTSKAVNGPDGPTFTPQPVPGASDVTTSLRGGRRRRAYMRGGAATLAANGAPVVPQPYSGVSMVYNAPHSGYTTWPSNAAGGNAGTLSDGQTPFLINVPYSGQPTPSPACLKTGGRRMYYRKSRRAERKRSAKKSRRAERKSRRTNRRANRK
jgi:hypothetical protein